MKRSKWMKITAWILVFFLILGLMPTSIQAEAKSRKTKLNNNKITLTVGNSKKIKLSNNSKKVKWTTSNKKVVKITKKSRKYVKVKALKAGTAKITAKVGTKKYVCKVTVKAKKGFFSKKEEATTESPKKPTTEAVTEAPKNPTTERLTTEDKKETTEKLTTEDKKDTSEKPTTEEKTETTEKSTTEENTGTSEKPTTEEKTEKPEEGGTTEKPTDPPVGTEDPEQRYTRLEWVKLLLDSIEVKTITEDGVPKDPNGNTLYSYVDLKEEASNLTVETAVQQGILVPSEGQEEDVYFFRPEEMGTREFAAVTAARALGYLESEKALECTDQESLEYPLWDAAAVNIGLIGLKEGSFNGKEELTGAEANQMLVKIKEIKAEENAVPEKVVDIQYADDLVKDSVAGLTDYLVTETGIGYQITINNYTGTMEETGIEAGRPIFLPADKYGKYPEGFVCRVADAGMADGQINISGTPVESVFEVMDSFHLSGSAVIDEIVLADGVNVKNAENEEAMDSRLSANPEEASDGLTEEEMDSKLGSKEINLQDGSAVLKVQDEYGRSIEVELKEPQLVYDINTSKKKGDKKFKVVLSNQGTFTVKGEVIDAEAIGKKEKLEHELYRAKTPIDIGGNFKITPIFKVVVEPSGDVSCTVDVSSTVGVDIQKERRIISDLTCNLGVNCDFSLSVGPEVDVVFSWVSKELKIGSVKLGAGIKIESSTSSASDINGGIMFCMENALSGYFVVGLGDTGEKTVLDKLLDKADMSISREWTKPIASGHYEARQSKSNPFIPVEKCTAAHNLHGAVLDKNGEKVKADRIIIRNKENPEQEFGADNRTEGYYSCRVPDGDYEIIAMWDGVIKIRKDITVEEDTYYDIREGGIIDSGIGTGYSWTITEDGNFECEVDETADMVEVKGIIHNYAGSMKSAYVYGTVGEASMDNFFGGCTKLVSINLSKLNTQKVNRMDAMFCGCVSLTELDLSNLNTGQVETMENMFTRCSSLTKLDLSSFDTSQVKTMYGMFSECSSITELDISSFDTSNVETMYGMFFLCCGLTELNLSNFNTSKVTSMCYMFDCCCHLTKLDLSGFDTGNVTDIGFMFMNCGSLQEVDVSNFDTSNMESLCYTFSGCSSLKELDLGNFNTSKVKNMNGTFLGCHNLTELNLSVFDTSQVETMQGMFSGCSGLVELDLTSFNTSNVQIMSGMFSACTSLQKINLSSFDTSNVGNMAYMFEKCSSLMELDLSNFDIDQAYRYQMFTGCRAEIIPDWY